MSRTETKQEKEDLKENGNGDYKPANPAGEDGSYRTVKRYENGGADQTRPRHGHPGSFRP